MITEQGRMINFGARTRRHWGNAGLGQDWTDTFDVSLSTPDFSFDWNPIDLSNALPDNSGMLISTLPADSAGPSVSPMIDPSFDWSGTFKGLVQTAGALAPAITSIVKSVTGEGQATQQATPPGYVRNAMGQLVPIQPTGGGMSWVMIAALAAGAYFLAKK